MAKKVIIMLICMSLSYSLSAQFQRFSDIGKYTDISQASVSSRLTSKIAPGTPLGEQVGAQVQKYEGMGQEKLQTLKPVQRFQEVQTQVQQPLEQPTQTIQSRFGGGRFF